eukprot:3753917-Pyramimonas_sp.AAC.1
MGIWVSQVATLSSLTSVISSLTSTPTARVLVNHIRALPLLACWLREHCGLLFQLGMYVVPEGGYEGRFALAAKRNTSPSACLWLASFVIAIVASLHRRHGYQIININARGLGDVEAYLTKVRISGSVSSVLFSPFARTAHDIAQAALAGKPTPVDVTFRFPHGC